MLHILRGIVAAIIGGVLLYAIVAVIYNIPYDLVPYLLIGWGLILLIMSILSNIKRNSPIKIGAANHGEFYAVITVLIGILIGINGRVDALNVRIDDTYQLLMTIK